MCKSLSTKIENPKTGLFCIFLQVYLVGTRPSLYYFYY